MKNYYKIMGLKTTATEKEIKNAYRLLAKRYHPDMNPGNAAAAEKFADLSEAYDTLSDPIKKAQYDRLVGEVLQQRATQSGVFNNPYSAYAQNQYPNGQYEQTNRQYASQQYARQQAQQQYNRQQFSGSQNGYGGYGQAQANAYGYKTAQQQYIQQQQAQMQQLVKKISEAQRNGYTKGYETGFNDARNRLSTECEHLRAESEILKHSETEHKAEIVRLKDALDNLEADVAAMKADFEDKREKKDAEIEELNSEIDRLIKEQAGKAKRSASDGAQIKSLKESLAASEKAVEQLRKKCAEHEQQLSEVTGKVLKKETALTDMKLENNRLKSEKKYYEDEFERIKKIVAQREQEIELLNETIAQWEDFSNALDTAEAMKNMKGQWEKQLRDVKKKLKNTYYGTLGILYIATEEEIKESFRKIVKRYTKKAETDKSYEKKLQDVNEAFKALSDPDKRREYNDKIGVSDEEIAEFAEIKRKHEEGMERLEQEQGEQEFWAYVEDLMYSAQTGDAESQNRLGEMYLKGDELERDEEQAVYWFKEAAKLKYPSAYYNLGVCFLTGDGVEKDREKAEGFIKQAAKYGHEGARRLIESDYSMEVVEEEMADI